MSQSIEQKVEQWLTGTYDQATKEAILDLQSKNKEELADSFYRNLEFESKTSSYRDLEEKRKRLYRF